jgi:hypothetical protein
MKATGLPNTFALLCRIAGLPDPVPEYRFDLSRRWKVDWAFVDVKIAVEVEGGAWKMGRHNRPASFLKEMEKYNRLAVLGWRLIRLTPQQFASGEAVALVAAALEIK